MFRHSCNFITWVAGVSFDSALIFCVYACLLVALLGFMAVGLVWLSIAAV